MNPDDRLQTTFIKVGAVAAFTRTFTTGEEEQGEGDFSSEDFAPEDFDTTP